MRRLLAWLNKRYMNGGFRWTMLVLMALGIMVANAVLTTVVQVKNDREVIAESILLADSLDKARNDSLLHRLDLLEGGLRVNRDRIYRLNDSLDERTPEREAKVVHKEKRHWSRRD